jgi:AcrR family transcriptional regulator
MARRADHTREELKELAIKAGLSLIKKGGLAGFSARKVAAKIGYTVGTIYNVFGTYDDLMLHINAATLDEWYAFTQEALARKKGNPLRAIALAYIEFSRTHYNQWLALFEYHQQDERNLPDWYAPKMMRFFSLVEEHLGATAGGNRRKAKNAGHILWSGIHGICVLSHSGKLLLVDSEEPEALALTFIDTFLAGFSKA